MTLLKMFSDIFQEKLRPPGEAPLREGRQGAQASPEAAQTGSAHLPRLQDAQVQPGRHGHGRYDFSDLVLQELFRGNEGRRTKSWNFVVEP